MTPPAMIIAHPTTSMEGKRISSLAVTSQSMDTPFSVNSQSEETPPTPQKNAQ